MSKLSFIAAAVLAGSVFSAQAATAYDLSTVLSVNGASNLIAFQTQVKKDGVIDADTISFDLLGDMDVTLDVLKSGAADKTGTFFLSQGSSTNFASLVIGAATGTYSQSWTLAAGNDYLLTFAPADLSKTAKINYSVSLSALPVAGNPPTPAVPEPETYALVAAGLAVVGFTARRRAKANA